MSGPEDRDRIFNEQLERCGVNYFDFYLLHSLENGTNYETYTKYNCFDWGMLKKQERKIRHFGCSFHGTPELLEQVLEEHPEIEFVQIQLNYADWNNQVVHSGRLYEILHQHNIPIIVMEPVKGGILANLQPELNDIFKTIHPEAFCGISGRSSDDFKRYVHGRTDVGEPADFHSFSAIALFKIASPVVSQDFIMPFYPVNFIIICSLD